MKKTHFAYTSFILLVLFIKFAYIFTSVYLIHVKRHLSKTTSSSSPSSPPKQFHYSELFSKTSTPEETIQLLTWVKERLEFIFVFLMAVFLIVFFSRLTSPDFYAEVVFETETKVLMVFLGIILLLEAPWKTFFQEAHLFTDLKKVVS